MSLEDIYNDLMLKFPANNITQYEFYIFLIYKNKEDETDIWSFEISSEKTNKTYDLKISGNSEKTMEIYDLKDFIERCNDLPIHQIPANAIEIFITEKFDDYIGEELNAANMGNKTELYRQFQSMKNVENQIRIFSFGKKFDNPTSVKQRRIVDLHCIPYKCDETFDARRANAKHAAAHRGTEEILQRCVESGSGYDNLMTEIVTYIDSHNPKVIGIFCTAGHHRSVALVELLKKYVYKNAIIKHLHINK